MRPHVTKYGGWNMNQYVFGAICLAVLIAFGSYYLTSDLGGNSHFDKAGENWKRK